jgi:hypothetical protein
MKLRFFGNLLEYSIFSVTILMVFLVFFEKYLVVPMLLQWMGHWHPLILHFPIVLIFVTIIQYWRKDTNVKLYLGVTTLFALISSLSGFILSTENATKGNQILTHQWAGIGVSALLVIWWYFYQPLQNKVTLVKGVQVLLTVLIIFTGHVGGFITHGENFLSFKPEEAEELVVVENPNIYASFVQPIFDDKCTKCHNANKSKGKLILTDYLSLAAGGEFGPGLDFSDLGESSLKYHIELPLEDEYHMPPSDEEQLTEDELMILNSWLEAGASDTMTMLGLKEESRLFAYIHQNQIDDDQKRYSHFPDITDEKLLKLSSNYIAINRMYHGTGAVSVRVYPNTTYNPSQLKPISAITKNIVSLDLSSIDIGDQEITFIKSCKNLEMLNLSNSRLEDKTLENIGVLENLRTLNLLNTAITDASVTKLTVFPKLSEVFVYGSQITNDGVVKLLEPHERLRIFKESTLAKEFSSVLPPATVAPLQHFFNEPFKIDITHPLAGIDVFYTLDGTLPDSQSAKFTVPLQIGNSTIIKFLAMKDGWESSRVDSVQMIYAGTKPDTLFLFSPPDIKYPGRGVNQLIDLQKGPDSFSDSAWMAFRDNEFVLRCSWNEEIILNEIILSSLVNTDSHLFPPELITIKASVGKSELKTIYSKKSDGLRDRRNSPITYFHCTFNCQKVSFVEITVRPLPKIPLWHQGIGQKGWFFIDEVVFVNGKSDDSIR